MAKRKHIWIYEYKDDESPVGASFYYHENDDEPLKLPHLCAEWHWQIAWEDCDCEGK